MINREGLLKLQEETFRAATAILKTKNADYASDASPFDNFLLFGEDAALRGIVHRMGDKLRRLWKDSAGGSLECEPVEDTCIDLINYAVLYMGVRKEVQGRRE